MKKKLKYKYINNKFKNLNNNNHCNYKGIYLSNINHNNIY